MPKYIIINLYVDWLANSINIEIIDITILIVEIKICFLYYIFSKSGFWQVVTLIWH